MGSHRRVVAVAAIFAAAACTSPGRLLVSVDSDYSVPDELPMVRATVRDQAGMSISSVDFTLHPPGSLMSGTGSSFELPLSFLVEPLGGDSDRRVSIEIEGHRSADGSTPPRLIRRAFTGFIEGKTLVLPMYLARACEGIDCALGQTCDVIEGVAQCVDALRPPDTLRPIDVPGVEIPRDAGHDGGPGADAARLDGSSVDAALDAGRDAGPGIDAGFDSCTPRAETCDLRDEDCDTRVDEDFDSRTDELNCGRCGNACAPGFDCEDGVCGEDIPRVLAVGRMHTCVLRGDGRVYCWGSNIAGQLGRGVATNRSAAPVAVTGVSDAVDLASGSNHACAVVGGGSVLCWGDNLSGQLGNGEEGIGLNPTPVRVEGITSARRISAGANSTCALLADGTARCWGSGVSGQLGTGSTGSSPTPAVVVGVADGVDIVSGSNHACVLRAGGSVSCWGKNTSGQLGDGSMTDRWVPVTPSGLAGVDFIEAGFSNTCVVAAGRAYCWGENDEGELPGITAGISATPVEIPSLSGLARVSVGSQHICALEASGGVSCWGAQYYGVLGVGPVTPIEAPDMTAPHRLPPGAVVSLTDAVDIDSGNFHTCARRRDGSIACWGYNEYRQTSHAPPEANEVYTYSRLPSSARTFSTHPTHSCAILSDERVYCWGEGQSGAIGDREAGAYNATNPEPIRVEGVPLARDVAISNAATCAVDMSNEVWCWGSNSTGQLANGVVGGDNRLIPDRVSGLSATAIFAGANHFCVKRSDDKLACWGHNAGGQLGDGTTTNGTAPIEVVLPGTPTLVALGTSHSCAAVVGGALYCWGVNTGGQLGDGTTQQRLSPVLVPSVTSPVAITAGGGHTCALRSDGVVLCWGTNSEGQLGDGLTTNRSTPAPVVDLVGATAIGAADRHTCAVIAGGAVSCWGYNNREQLGDGTFTSRTRPVPVRNLTGARSVAGGVHYTTALLTDGRLATWGFDFYGEQCVGNAYYYAVSPVRVPDLP